VGIKLLIADEHAAVRAGVYAMLGGTDIEIVGEASTLGDAIERTRAQGLSVLMLDLRFQDQDAFSAIAQIRQESPNVSVLVFTASDNVADMTRARELGASGYVVKTATRDELLQAIHRAAESRDAWTRQQVRRISGAPNAREPSAEQNGYLTPRETEVLRKVVDGLVNDDIAAQLNIHVETVKQHVKHILEKLGVEDRTQAAVWAVRNGLV
jgi:DNA-binding NarL/FixJ family response regulator